MTHDRPEEQWCILYFGTDWNAENRTSAHHVARWLGDRHHLLYFECPGLRAPSTSARDTGRIWRKLKAVFARPRHPMPTVEVRTLFQLPFHRLTGVAVLNRLLLKLQVDLAKHGARRIISKHSLISWFVAPHVAPLAGRMGEAAIVYYCVDDFAAFPGVDSDLVRGWDDQLTQIADVVFVASATMIERKKGIAKRLVHAPHGVDVEHFSTAREIPISRPSDIPTKGPIIGYFGSIAEWTNLGLVGRLAKLHPDWQFVLIGGVSVPSAELDTLTNVHFLGRRPYEQLPTYGAWFDVAIIPYHLTPQVLHANPIKLREYIAMAKPIVTVSTPEIDKHHELVSIVDSDAEWESAITEALTEPHAPARSRRQIEAAAGMSWDSRLTKVEGEIRKVLDRSDS